MGSSVRLGLEPTILHPSRKSDVKYYTKTLRISLSMNSQRSAVASLPVHRNAPQPHEGFASRRRTGEHPTWLCRAGPKGPVHEAVAAKEMPDRSSQNRNLCESRGLGDAGWAGNRRPMDRGAGMRLLRTRARVPCVVPCRGDPRNPAAGGGQAGGVVWRHASEVGGQSAVASEPPLGISVLPHAPARRAESMSSAINHRRPVRMASTRRL